MPIAARNETGNCEENGDNDRLQALVSNTQILQSEEAEKLMTKIIDEDDWRVTYKQNSISSYEGYLAKHPGSVNRFDARARIDAIRENDAWQAAVSTNTIEAYEDFMAFHSQSTFAKAASSQNCNLKDKRDWAIAQQANTAISCENLR
ncbi:MAG: hypothetical protein U0176_18825 [Bacteroidia bacterium]